MLATLAAAYFIRREPSEFLPADFFVGPAELELNWRAAAPARQLAFATFAGTREEWTALARERLAECIGLERAEPGEVRALRELAQDGVRATALVMQTARGLSLPAYLLEPSAGAGRARAVMALHGHGQIDAMVGARGDYHHRFAWWLARAGYTVLCPELRGFGSLRDLALDDPAGAGLRYWMETYGHFTLASDAIQRGGTMIGATVGDLLAWEQWLCAARGFERLDVAGISYGGDLALIYPVFSQRVGRIFASGTLGSFEAAFREQANAPAHCIPGILEWLERSDIAGLNAPRPIAIHYGELDTEGAYGASAPGSVEELRRIYAAWDAAGAVELVVSTGMRHEMDVAALIAFLERGSAP